MSTPPASPWGPPSDDQDRPNPYAAPEAAPSDGAPPTDPVTGYPTGPAPSGYEARRPGEGAPVPPSYGSSTWTSGGPSTPYSPTAPSYGAPTPPAYGAPSSPYGASPYTSASYPPAGAYGYPGGPGTPPPGAWGPQQRPTDGLAIASLITSGAGLLTGGLTGPVGLGLGIGALRRIRRNGSGGHGLAIAGIVVGAFFTVVLVAVGIFVAWAVSQPSSYWEAEVSTSDSSPWWDDDSGSDDSGTWDDDLPAYELPAGFVPGDCFADYPQTYDMSDGDLVDCVQSHDGEVIALIDMTGPITDSLTGPDPVADATWDACTAQITGLLGADIGTVGSQDVFFPHPDQWATGQHTAYCLLVTDEWVSGSLVAGSWAPAGAPSTTT